MRRTKFLMVLLSVALFLGGVAHSATPTTEPAIIIDSTPPSIDRIMFDRFHKGPNVPVTQPGEAGVTQSNFECAARVTYGLVDQQKVGDHWHVVARIAKVSVITSLADKIYLPQMAPIELRAHEEGHRVMNERVYTEGEPIAKQIAQLVLDRDWPGDGKDVDAAGTAATDAAVHAYCDEYLRHTSRRASDLGDIYDKLTNHGRNALYVANAIKLSFLEEQKIAATQPATTQVSLNVDHP